MQAIYNRAVGLRESNLHGGLTAFLCISLVGSLGTMPSHKEKKLHFTVPSPITFTDRMHSCQSQITRELISFVVAQYYLIVELM